MMRRIGLHPIVALTASTHLIVDGFGNIYAPLLPLLIPRMDMSLATAGLLTTCFQLASSVSQLGFGHLADRWRPRFLLMTGPIVAVTILSLIGLAHSPFVLGLILILGGFGGAAFHPPAAALVHRVSGKRAALAMAFHITGGSIGYALGPLMFAPIVGRFGLHWTPAFALPGLLILAFTLRHVPPIELQHEGDRGGFRALRPYARPLSLLYLIVVFRTLASLSFATFVPVLLTRRGLSLGAAGAVATVYLFASGIGGFAGGPLAERFGARRVIGLSLLLAAPFLAIAPLLGGWAFTIVLALGGLFLQSTLPVNVTFGQSIAPISAATVSSLMMGFAWGTGGLSVPFVGMLADRIGLQHALMVMAAMPLAAAACAWPLPAGRPHVPARPSEVGAPEVM